MTGGCVPSELSYCIGYLGADWWGSDARALATELRSQGHLLVERHYEDYFSTKWHSFPLRVLRRVCRPLVAAEYNRAVCELLDIGALDFLLAFKGMLLDESTLLKFRKLGKPCYCVYPDVSYRDHGENIWKCLPHYDCVFTTKSYHLEDPELVKRVRCLQYVPHGFDPEVHRPVQLTARLNSYYGCDVSFVGVWSPKKEQILSAVIDALPDVDLRIWGPFWNRAKESVQRCWQKRSAYGDELAAICSYSRINLGLLSGAGQGTVEGDRTTARTWQIPACGGFLLHEDTNELRAAFVAGEEAAVFSSNADLVSGISQYLHDSEGRERIRLAGHQRCRTSQYSYRAAAERVLAFHRDRHRSP